MIYIFFNKYYLVLLLLLFVFCYLPSKTESELRGEDCVFIISLPWGLLLSLISAVINCSIMPVSDFIQDTFEVWMTKKAIPDD